MTMNEKIAGTHFNKPCCPRNLEDIEEEIFVKRNPYERHWMNNVSDVF